MRFHICTINHWPAARETLAEQIVWLTEGLESLGHEVTYSDSQAAEGAINVLWEAFHPEFAERLIASGHRYAIVATEVPDGAGWNHARHMAWPDRWKGFDIALKGAEFIWSLLPDAVSVYRAMGAKCAMLEYGFSERLRLDKSDIQDIDFFFYGGCGGHRQDRINALSRAGFRSFHPGTIVSNDVRDAMLRRAKVVLGLKYHDDWPYTSASRIGRVILAGCAVAHEWTETVLRPAHFVPMAEKDEDWIEFAAGVLAKAKEHAAAALERYRAEMPIKATMAAALEGVM